MIRLGLTGSIAMGKTTTAAMFRAEGVPVFNADQAVHDLYNGPAIPLISKMFPAALRDEKVDRGALSAIVLQDRTALERLEKLIHPLVRAEQARFSSEAAARRFSLVLFDIPLLFESGGSGSVDLICVATAQPEIQHNRVLGRRDMTQDKFEAILARQWPDAKKRRHAHFLVDTSSGMDSARRQVSGIVRALRFVT